MSEEIDCRGAEIEKTLQEIWSSIFLAGDVGIDDDFYDLGGDSLRAMLCISRIKERFGVAFSIEDFLLPGATISRIADLIRQS